jgi:hypothetical protein
MLFVEVTLEDAFFWVDALVFRLRMLMLTRLGVFLSLCVQYLEDQILCKPGKTGFRVMNWKMAN